MKVTVEQGTDSEAVLNVELEWDELEKASDRAYKKLAQQYNVPGFRRGKAPRSMIERMLGKDAIYQEGLEDLVDQSYRQAIRENGIQPIARPTVDAPPIEYGQPYTFTARVPVLTPVTLGDYNAIRVEQPPIEVSDQEIDDIVERIRQDQAIKTPVERAAQLGDFVTMDLKLTVGEKEVSNLHDNEFELVLERPGIFAGMDDEIIGMKESESKQFTTTIPEDYTNPELAGKEAQYDVKLLGVKVRELPEVDDELAKASGDFENVEQLRDAIRQQLLVQKINDARRSLRDEVVNKAVEGATVEPHQVLVDDEIHAMEHETERMLSQSRISLQQYLTMMQKSHEEYHQELEPEARERVKRDLALNAIADAEGVTASQDDVEQWLDNLNAISGDKPIRMSQLTANQLANIDGRIRRDKALARLIEIATEGRGDIVLPDLSEFAQAEDADEEDETEAETAERGAEAAASAGAEIDGKAEAETEAEAEANADAVAETEEESEVAEDADVLASAKASTPESTGDTEVPENKN
ncbi:MAG TPA: trigger factor [Ktedonobacterales bacterium]|nr:trigger factor [Ktedonobacterales bacterium]